MATGPLKTPTGRRSATTSGRTQARCPRVVGLPKGDLLSSSETKMCSLPSVEASDHASQRSSCENCGANGIPLPGNSRLAALPLGGVGCVPSSTKTALPAGPGTTQAAMVPSLDHAGDKQPSSWSCGAVPSGLIVDAMKSCVSKTIRLPSAVQNGDGSSATAGNVDAFSARSCDLSVAVSSRVSDATLMSRPSTARRPPAR